MEKRGHQMTDENIKIMPYFMIYAADFKVLRDKLNNDEIIEMLNAISDLCLYAETDFLPKTNFQNIWFGKIKDDFLKNLGRYKTSVKNGQKGGRPKKDKITSTNSIELDWKEMQEFFGYKCIACGTQMDERNRPTKDHIIPQSWGGIDKIENLQPLCRECNASKCADNSIDYRLKYNIPDNLKEKWGIKTHKEPMGFQNHNLDETQGETIKEKKRKENKREDKKTKDYFIDMLIEPESFKLVLAKWLAYRKDLKEKAQWEYQYKQLKTFTNYESIVNTSIGNGWKGLFETKDSNKQTTKAYSSGIF